jgi:hypothetical protein
MNAFCCLLLSVVMIGCSQCPSISRHDAAATKPTMTPTPPVASLESSYPDAPEWTLKAWHNLLSDGRYRLAQKADFDIPMEHITDTYKKIDINDSIGRPFAVVDANHDNRFKDLVAVVVDSLRTDRERFGIVIFNEPANHGEIPQPQWLYKEKDLSRTALAPWSGGVTVRTYRDDGTYDACYLKWTPTQGYSCGAP